MKNLLPLRSSSGATIALTALIALAAGCDDPDDLTHEEAFGAGEVDERCTNCGIKFNTNQIGKYPLSELDTRHGEWHGGAALIGVELARLGATSSVFAADGRLFATYNGATLPDKYLLDSVWSLQVMMDGVKTPAKMHLVDIDSVAGSRVYTFTHTHDGGPKNPLPNCDEDPDSPGMQYGAIVTGGITVDTKSGDISPRENTLYIGCLSGAVAKAARWGYPSHVVGLPAFEAGVRMVRADYCGNGFSFTAPGNPVELRDTWSINDFPAPAAPTEALWGKYGARCIGAPRHAVAYPTALAVQKKCVALGAPAPVACKPGDDLTSHGGNLYWSKNP